MADAEPSPVLEAQRKSHPELGEKIDLLQKNANAKLYKQLTDTLLEYLASPPFLDAGAASELRDFYQGFIKSFESKFDKVKYVQILAIVCRPQSADVALELIAPFEESVKDHKAPKFLWLALKGEKLVMADKLDDAKELLSDLGTEMDATYNVDAVIQSQFHKTNALLWKKLLRHAEFFKSSILYLAYTPLSAIPVEDRARLAFDIGVAALVAPEEFEFGELLQQELLGCVDGTEFAWIKEVLQAYGEGKFDMWDAAFSKHRASIDATPELKAAETAVLRSKMAVLALMELAFRKPKKQRRLTFEELAQHCRVGPKEVEHLVMKAMSAQLVKGQIDEVLQIVIVTWVKPRILDTVRIDLMRSRMDEWALKTGLLLGHLEEMTPELLVA